MRIFPTLLAGLLVFGSASVAAAQQAQRFRPVAIMDPSGFERPMPAAHIMIPADWQAQGGVRWNPQAPCQSDVVQHQWSATDPSGRFGVEVLPTTGRQWSTLPYPLPGCDNLMVRSVQEYLQALVQVMRQGATVLDFRPRPDLVAELAPVAGAMQAGDPNRRSWFEVGDILIGYQGPSGPMREMIGAVVLFNVMQMPGLQGTDAFVMGISLPSFAARAPEGQLDFQLADTIRRSFKPDPEWSMRRQEGQRAVAEINARGARDRARQNAEAQARIGRTYGEIGDIINQGYKDRQAMIDRGQESWSLMTREQEVYRDPMASGGQVELPNTYNHAWRLQDGTYMMTDNPNLNPNVDMGVAAERLQRAR